MNLYDLAVKLESQGDYREAKCVYSVNILQKFKFFWKYMPDIMRIIEFDF